MSNKNTETLVGYCGHSCSHCMLFHGYCDEESRCSSCKSDSRLPAAECKIAMCARKKGREFCAGETAPCEEYPCELYEKGFAWDIKGVPCIFTPYGKAYVEMFRQGKIPKE